MSIRESGRNQLKINTKLYVMEYHTNHEKLSHLSKMLEIVLKKFEV